MSWHCVLGIIVFLLWFGAMVWCDGLVRLSEDPLGMKLNKPELELLVKTVQPQKRGPAYSRLYAGLDADGNFLVCLDGTNIVFVGEGPPRIPDFRDASMRAIEVSIKELLKLAREATKPAKYDVKFVLDARFDPGVFFADFMFNGGVYNSVYPTTSMEDLLGMEYLADAGTSVATYEHQVSSGGLELMSQCASLSKNVPLKLFTVVSQTTTWGVVLAESPNGFAGVATVEGG